jgi:hypothetical protein
LKCKKAIILILTVLLSASTPAAFSEDTFSIDYTFEPAVGSCGEFLVKDTHIQALPGEPLVPYRAAAILLPQDAVVKDVKVKSGMPIVQNGFDIPWGQPPCTFSDEPVIAGPNEEIYNSMAWYPKRIFKVVSVESFRGFQILNVILYPVQYQPKSGTVKFYETMTVDIQFGKGSKHKLYRGLQGDKQAVESVVDNPEMTGTYEDGPSPLQTEEYLIITNDTMQSAFQQLANWKANFVNGAGVYTVSWITANYSGVDDAEKIRNFIKDMYVNHGTLYVLLGGDIAAVPYRGFYIYSGGYTDYDMLADMYFAHLDGTFNDDGDSYWAEPGEEDWYAEVAVGRAPCETVAEAQNFINKVIAYEQTDKPKRVLLHQSRVQPGNNPDSRCLAYKCDDYIPSSYYIDYLFEENGTVTKTKWRNAWAAGPIAVAHIGHGNTNIYHINYEVGGTVSWYNSDVASLTNTFWPWTTSVACICGEIEANDCLAEAYVMDPDNGAIAAIYNDNYGWFSTLDACKYSGEFCEMEFKACWHDGYEKFGDMLNQARSYMVSSAQSNSTYRWCFYERNLVGDPETPSLGPIIPPPTVTITSPSNGQEVYGIWNITTFTTRCIDTVEFYIDGVLEYTDTAAPFEYAWDTTTHAEDTDATILVKGYCTGEFKDDDTVTCHVNNYYVVITNPPNGAKVSGTVTIATSTRGVDTVEFYIDGVLKYTDTTEPFWWGWDTTEYRDGDHTITAKGYDSGVFRARDEIIAIIWIQPPVWIIDPQDGATVKGKIPITTLTYSINTAEFYIDGVLKYTDTTEPFEWTWNTKSSKDGDHTITVMGYYSGIFIDDDTITVTVKNKKKSIALLSWLILFLPAAVIARRR